jgi:hypothetical protein
MANHLKLAVAGSGKTRDLVEYCASLPLERRVAVLTYTQANQAVLRSRLATKAGNHHDIEVMGWFTFLLRHFARPFFPFKFPKRRIQGFDFEGRPHRMATGLSRFLSKDGEAYASELGRLSFELIAASSGSLMRRLECVFDEILIDEVQDLSAYDWDILDALLKSSIDLWMVGDVRQAVLATNPRSSKNKAYAYAGAIQWFRERETQGLLNISESSRTWRCRPEIAQLADTIFSPEWSFPPTASDNKRTTGHDGVFLIRPEQIGEYISAFNPKCLRNSANSGKSFQLDYTNFKVAKGTEHERVLIVPTQGITKFLLEGIHLAPGPAATLYVAVTRASQSVAFVVSERGNSEIPWWK